MTSELLDRYRKLMSELLIVREIEGGDLPVEIESAYVERLDDIWWQLSKEQQDAYEAELANEVPSGAQAALNLVDCKVSKGEQTHPRKAA